MQPPHALARLLDISRELHGSREYEAAYHALASALHVAGDRSDVASLEIIAAEAATQLAWIDAHEPTHRLSSSSAARHTHPGVYAMLIQQAGATMQIVRLNQHVNRPEAEAL